MGKINKSFKDQRAEIANINHNLLSHIASSEAKSYYTCWGLQQMNPSLAPIPPTSISAMIQDNVHMDNQCLMGCYVLGQWENHQPEIKEKPQLTRMQFET
ncbi:hypothetical protein PIB30_089640 [Stylosanthes scabra]|uniref:Uncharacterized protein n=1 Tax=Stylosanthes scabra TaxID=79078 RepID=A0ABU6VTR0_9FABA|nr:hypothetical protein [Stylosanthes scabra]